MPDRDAKATPGSPIYGFHHRSVASLGHFLMECNLTGEQIETAMRLAVLGQQSVPPAVPGSVTPLFDPVCTRFWAIDGRTYGEVNAAHAEAVKVAVSAERAECLKALIAADGRHDAIDAIRARGD